LTTLQGKINDTKQNRAMRQKRWEKLSAFESEDDEEIKHAHDEMVAKSK
jgi:hypothetical protein